MKRFFVWLALYLVISIVSINIGINLGISDHGAAIIPLGCLSIALLIYVQRFGVDKQIGLGVAPAVPVARMWFYLPLLALVVFPLSRGLRGDLTVFLVIMIVLHYLFVGFLEEVLFRGFLLQALLKETRPLWAILVTAVTFGLGHVTSLLIGQGGADTLRQILNAIVVGLIFTLVVFVTGNLHAVIVAHILYNICAVLSPDTVGISTLIFGIVVLLIYGSWLLFGVGGREKLKNSQRPIPAYF